MVNKMNEFEEVWLANNEHEVNQLIEIGWKFVQVVYEETELQSCGWFSCKTIGTKRHAKFLMGRSKGVLPREKGEYAVWQYIERLQKDGEQQK